MISKQLPGIIFKFLSMLLLPEMLSYSICPSHLSLGSYPTKIGISRREKISNLVSQTNVLFIHNHKLIKCFTHSQSQIKTKAKLTFLQTSFHRFLSFDLFFGCYLNVIFSSVYIIVFKLFIRLNHIFSDQISIHLT